MPCLDQLARRIALDDFADDDLVRQPERFHFCAGLVAKPAIDPQVILGATTIAVPLSPFWLGNRIPDRIDAGLDDNSENLNGRSLIGHRSLLVFEFSLERRQRRESVFTIFVDPSVADRTDRNGIEKVQFLAAVPACERQAGTS